MFLTGGGKTASLAPLPGGRNCSPRSMPETTMTAEHEPLRIALVGPAADQALAQRLEAAGRAPGAILLAAGDASSLLAGGAADAALIWLAAGDDVAAIASLVPLLDWLGLARASVVAVEVDGDAERLAAALSAWRQAAPAGNEAPLAAVPVNAAGEQPAWYEGPGLVEALARLEAMTERRPPPFRLLVEAGESAPPGTSLAGRLLGGQAAVGDEIVLSPSNQVARISALAGGERLVLELDRAVSAEAGEIVSLTGDAPIETDVFRARFQWQEATELEVGDELELELCGRHTPVRVQSLEAVIGPPPPATAVAKGELAEAILRSYTMLALDAFAHSPASGRFSLLRQGQVVGRGIVSMAGYADQRDLVTVRATNVTRVPHTVTTEARTRLNGHRGGVLWFTGLSASGKSTLAVEVERQLFARDFQVYVLDGDNIRHGLNANLGFSPEDRSENIRRVGEVAALFARAGFIALTAFISPYRSDRQRAREAAEGDFHEIFVDADLAACEERDPKGLYKRARDGEIPDFTGISAPYEAPESPELAVDTVNHDVAACVEQIIDYIESELGTEAAQRRSAG